MKQTKGMTQAQRVAHLRQAKLRRNPATLDNPLDTKSLLVGVGLLALVMDTGGIRTKLLEKLGAATGTSTTGTTA